VNRLFYNRVYLSGPIDNAKDFGVGWRQMVQETLSDLDLIFLDPCKKPLQASFACEDLENHQRRRELKKNGDFETVAREMRLIRCIDLRLADLCDWAIVHLDLNVYSTGTHEEIATLNRRKVPILIHVQQGKASLPDWYWGAVPHQHVFGDWDDLFAHIRHIAHDPPPIDTFNRWRFLDYGALYGKTTIRLSKERVATISPEDHAYLSQFAWHAVKMRHGYYGYRTIQRRRGGTHPCGMHIDVARRMGLAPTRHCQIDHINRDTLDNRRENLRSATPSQQNCNQDLRRDNATGVKGVSFNKHVGRYEAYVAINGKRRFHELFDTLEEAASAVKEARKRLHQEFACNGDANEA
jgi:hypothetical protein